MFVFDVLRGLLGVFSDIFEYLIENSNEYIYNLTFNGLEVLQVDLPLSSR